MANMMVLEFEGVSEEAYRAVSARMGIDPAVRDSDWPAGLLHHAGGASGGTIIVVEVWNSVADQEAFMSSRLGPALAAEQLPPPSSVRWFDVLAATSLG